MPGFHQREDRFFGDEDHNYVTTVVVIQRNPVGELQDWRVL